MPLFEFSCRKCSHVFEELMTSAQLADSKLKCPACGSARVEKAFSSFATGVSGGPSSGPVGGCPGGGCGSGGFT